MRRRLGKFEEVIFIQGWEAEEPVKILDEQGVEAAVNYLSQWDYGENEIKKCDYYSLIGNQDHVYEHGEYLLNVYPGLPYIGLTRIVEEDRRKIKFIDSHYKEIFQIENGQEIRITFPEGDSVVRVCQYIDDYHMYVGDYCYHICEFAERMESAGNKVEPMGEVS